VQTRANDDLQHTVRGIGDLSDQIVGDFTAALRVDDQQWRVVRPAD
jgi:hypothetical protein